MIRKREFEYARVFHYYALCMEPSKATKKSISEREEEILKFWQENKIFEKSLELRRGGEEFVFYDGPPFATGLPHYGHILASVLKDVIPRYETMRGKYVARRWGWDCHGLPLENLIEQELGLLHKKDIEEYGVGKFNKKAEEAVLRYADDWKKMIPRIGRWVDMEHDYRTMDWAYTESVWWVFKTLYEKGLIHEGYKSMHLCPRCETTLANFEVSQGYKDIKDIAVTVKFVLESASSESMAKEDEVPTYVLAWTTTPWTLPGNVALAVKPDILYAKFQIPNSKFKEYYVAVKDRLAEVVKEDVEILEEYTGSKLVGKKYKPLFNYYSGDASLKNRENGWKIYAADFVTTNEGTGIVHIAPAFGEEDMTLGKKENLPFIQHVAVDGTFKPEVKDFAGLPVKPKGEHQKTDIEILKYLDAHGLLFKKESITHSYPHCWRCETPLLNYAATSWFVNVEVMRPLLRKTNEEITWVPSHLKEGRFGKGLETAPDWAISRSRYWGAPLPVWKCGDCEETFVAGKLADLSQKRTKKKSEYMILRHGEREDIPHEKDHPSAYGPVTIRMNPDADIHISKRGKDVVADVAATIQSEGGIDFIYASDFVRCRETAGIVSEKLGVPVAYDERLRELNHGDEFEGKTVAEYKSFFKTPLERFTKKPAGGETLHDVQRRMMNFIRELDATHEGKRILIVSHGDPLWILEGALRGDTAEEYLRRREKEYIKQGELRHVALENYPYDEDGRLNLHRPYIDEITLQCGCGGDMRRILEVFDCWFESGSMPYGQHHYIGKPLKDFNPQAGEELARRSPGVAADEEGSVLRSSKSEGGFPADFIAEGLDQTRGWFYSLHVLAGALFEKPAYRHVLVNGTILAEDGQKMSKRLKNYPDPMEIVNTYGADALRLYLLMSPAVLAEDLNFLVKGVDEVYKKNIVRMQNVYSFYEMYAKENLPILNFTGTLHPLDSYILYQLRLVEEIISKALFEYRLDTAVRSMADFIDKLSTFYLQYSRDRFREDTGGQTLSCFRFVLANFSKLLAPFAPFLAEHLYDQVKQEDKKESVHLEDWPDLGHEIPNYADIHIKTSQTRGVVDAILAARSAARIPVRQPLALARVKDLPGGEEYADIIKTRTNIERLEEDKKLEVPAWIDTAITPELKEKGRVREFVRAVQDARKKEGLVPADKIILHVNTQEKDDIFFSKFRENITQQVGADDLEFVERNGQYGIPGSEEDTTISFSIQKLEKKKER